MHVRQFHSSISPPNKGRIAVCSYAYYNLLKQDPAFVRYGDASQKMLSKGILGDVDGCRIMRVPNDRLPAGASCLVTHPYAMTAPEKLRDYIIHDNPPDWSGWKVEGLLCYDAFVLNEKADGIFYIGASGVNKRLQASTMPSNSCCPIFKKRYVARILPGKCILVQSHTIWQNESMRIPASVLRDIIAPYLLMRLARNSSEDTAIYGSDKIATQVKSKAALAKEQRQTKLEGLRKLWHKASVNFASDIVELERFGRRQTRTDNADVMATVYKSRAAT